MGPAVLLTAVVKADAYGHGVVAVARCALESGADRLAVASPAEGSALRRAGLSAPILVLGPTPPNYAADAVTHSLTVTVNSLALAQALSAAASYAGRPIQIHVKVDTGMGRYGLLPDEVLPFVQAVSSLPGIVVEGLWTHFATSDEEDDTYLRRQLATLLDVDHRLQTNGIRVPLRHCANSAAALRYPATRLDMVRCGLVLYGLYPGEACKGLVDLRPVMSLKSTVCRLRWLPAGSSVSYGRTFTTVKPTLVAFMPMGYADGLRRALSNRGTVLVRGQRVPLIGRICMDGCMADVSMSQGVQEGDEVVFLGRQGQDRITADEIADLLGTIAYEVVTAVGPRVPRVYVQGGRMAQ